MSARPIRHSVIVAPSSRALSWLAMVSASGSSGMASVPLRTQLADEANGAFQVGERRRPRPTQGALLDRVLIRHPLDQAQVGDDHRPRSSHAGPTAHHQTVLLLVLLKPLDRFIQLSRIGLDKLLERNPGVGQPRRGSNLALRRHVQDCGHEPGGTCRIFGVAEDRKSTRLNSSHGYISYAVFC